MVGVYQFLKRYGVAIGFGFGALLALTTYAIILGGYPATSPTEEELYGLSIFDFGILAAKYLVYLAAFLAFIVFPIVQIAQDPKGSMKMIIMLVAVVIIYFITQAMGDGTLTLEMINSDESLLAEGEVFESGVSSSPNVAFADGLIKFGYFMLGGAILSSVFSVAYSFIKQQ